MTVQRAKTATMQRQPKQIVEYNHTTSLIVSDHITIL